MSFRFDENGVFRGDVTFTGTLTMPDGTVVDGDVAAAAGIAASKLEHDHRPIYSQESATTAAAETKVVHIAKGDGTLNEFKAGCVVANIGAATVTVDLTVNGVSVLTAAIEIDSGDAAYALVEGAIDTTAIETGDVIEVAVTVAAGGGTLGKGVFAYLDLDEDYQ